MQNEFIVVPYRSVGLIEFGMNKSIVEAILYKPNRIIKKKERTNMIWKNLSVKFDKNDLVNEVSFIDGEYRVFYNGIDLLSEPFLDKILDKIDISFEKLGFKVYFSLGFAITGFSGFEDDKAINIFSKDIKERWKKFIEK